MSCFRRNACTKEEFQCETGECIYTNFVCDGESDCIGGEDEFNCTVYSDLFTLEAGFRLQTKDEVINNISAEKCAEKCVKSKRCTCISFSHNPAKERCILGNRYVLI